MRSVESKHGMHAFRFNANVIGSCVASSSDTLEGVLQLGEVQTSLRLIIPATQHQLIATNIENQGVSS